jgi:NAD(P)-dependent dehydrogenase (short-subunit alcohol dehydrogenase family)
MSQPLAGKRILVTGAARRIGRAIALHLASLGAQVGVHYSSSRGEAEATAKQCEGELFQADLARVDQVEALFAEVRQRWGRLDGLVNNAARFTTIDPLQVTEADWDFIHEVNLKAVFFCCQQAARLMLDQEEGGRIVNLSSGGALRPWPHNAHYCASKAGVVHMTRALAIAWAPRISVNSVAPGVIPFEEADEAWIQALVRKTPAARAGSGDEIAAAVAHFLTASRFTTGQLLSVDGGISLA